jgi:hypothetical protein
MGLGGEDATKVLDMLGSGLRCKAAAGSKVEDSLPKRRILAQLSRKRRTDCTPNASKRGAGPRSQAEIAEAMEQIEAKQ